MASSSRLESTVRQLPSNALCDHNIDPSDGIAFAAAVDYGDIDIGQDVSYDSTDDEKDQDRDREEQELEEEEMYHQAAPSLDDHRMVRSLPSPLVLCSHIIASGSLLSLNRWRKKNYCQISTTCI